MIGLGISVWLAGMPAGAEENQEPRLRIGLMIAAQDVFSRRAASLVEHLGAQRLDREAGLELVFMEEESTRKDSSSAQSKYQAASQLLKKGQMDYENLELDKAVRGLSTAAEQFEKLPVELLRKKGNDYGAALIFLAAAYILTGDLPAGEAAFRRLLVSDRRAKLDKSLFPPSMVNTFEGVRQSVVQGPVGSLSVISVPSHGKVYIDRVFRGITPCTVDSLPAGKHLVVIRKAGHQSWSGAAAVEGGGERQVRCMLKGVPDVQKTVELAQQAAGEIEDDEPLNRDLQESVAQAKLDRLILGRLVQRGDGLAYTLALYEVSSGKVVTYNEGALQEGNADFAQSVDRLFSYLITGRGDLLKEDRKVALRDDELQLKDEERFDGQEPVPVYKKWWFWTAIGAGAGVLTVVLVLLLPTSEEPQSQILLEF